MSAWRDHRPLRGLPIPCSVLVAVLVAGVLVAAPAAGGDGRTDGPTDRPTSAAPFPALGEHDLGRLDPRGRVLVAFDDDTSASSRVVAAAASDASIVAEHDTLGVTVLDVDDDAEPDEVVAALADRPEVLAASPSRLLSRQDLPNDPLFGEQRSLNTSGEPTVVPIPESVVLNLTATNGTKQTYLSVYPGRAQRPFASNLNAAPGQTVANLVQARLSDDGHLEIFNADGFTDVVADLAGYHRGGEYFPTDPVRLVDTRSGVGAPTGPLGPATSIVVQILNRGGVPGNGTTADGFDVDAPEAWAGLGYPTTTGRLCREPTEDRGRRARRGCDQPSRPRREPHVLRRLRYQRHRHDDSLRRRRQPRHARRRHHRSRDEQRHGCGRHRAGYRHREL